MAGQFQYYEGKDGWRWRLVAGNSQTIATGGEAYSSKQAVTDAIDRVVGYASNVHDESICEASMPVYHKHEDGTTIVEVDG